MRTKEQILLKEYIRLPMPDIVNYEGANYVREGRAPKIGVMVALDKNRWGWSVISPREDLFEVIPAQREVTVNGKTKTINGVAKVWSAEKIWERGTFIALERALGDAPTPKIVPSVARKSIERFQNRMKRYFK